MDGLADARVRELVRGRDEADRLRWLRHQNMPAELANGRLALSEREVRTSVPVPLRGVPDQVFLSDAGVLVPVDTKTRRLPLVFMRDVVQLSVCGGHLRRAGDGRGGREAPPDHRRGEGVLPGRHGARPLTRANVTKH